MQRRPSVLAALSAVVLLSLAAAPEARARADRAYAAPQSQAAPKKATFWERVKSPHLDEIRRLTAEAVYLRQNIAWSQYWDPHLQPARKQVLRDALVRFERAASLDPRRADLRLDAAHTALEAGEYERAVAHYLAYRERSTDNAMLVTYNLAEAYVRLRRFDDAVEELEPVADDAGNHERGRFLTLLGQAFMAQGQLDDAIAALERAVAGFPGQAGGGIDYLAVALLAAAYDRDEQLGRAHDMIDQLRAVDPQFYVFFQQLPVMAVQAPSQRFYLIFSPPAEKHYYLALFHEAQGRYADAAASWRAYLDSAEPLYARRAQQHLTTAQKALEEASRQKALAAKNAARKARAPKPPQKVLRTSEISP